MVLEIGWMIQILVHGGKYSGYKVQLIALKNMKIVIQHQLNDSKV